MALDAFIDESRKSAKGAIRLVEVDAHINDRAFADAALAVFDEWVAQGVVPRGQSGAVPPKGTA
jgi:uncharacterized protein (UPF0261 family)